MNQPHRSQAHVAQQSRREKLRIQQQQTPSSPKVGSQADTSGYPNYLLHQGTTITSTTVPQQQAKGHSNTAEQMPMYDANMISSEMFNFPTGAELLGVQSKGVVLQQASTDDGSDRPIGTASYSSFGHPSSNLSGIKTNAVPNLGNWKSLISHSELPVKYIQGLPNAAYVGQNAIAPPFLGGILKDGGATASSNIHAQADAMQLYLMNPGYPGYADNPTSAAMHHPSNEGQETHKHVVEVPLHFSNFQQNNGLPIEVATCVGSQGLCIAQLPPNLRESAAQGQWPSGSNELILLPSYGNVQNGQYMSPRYSNAVSWAARQGLSLQWNQESFEEGKGGGDFRNEQLSMGNDRSGQGLSLSLSSHHPSEMQLQQFQAMASHRANVLQVAADAKAKSEDLFNRQGANGSAAYVSLRDGVPGKGYANTIQGVGGASAMELHINMGPFGPFTGYASVLKNSKYLKPAQLLLDEFCNLGRGLQTNYMPKQKVSTSRSEEWVDRSLTVGGTDRPKSEVGGKTGNFNAASTSTYASGETPSESGMEPQAYSSDRFEIQRKKAKLSSMLDEVHRRYREYCEQMQMVKASFEAIAGMGAAAPYTQLALKAMSRHFRCLRDAISNQLGATKKALGEDYNVPGTSRGETPRLRFLDQSLRQQRQVQHLGMLEQHAWRPQRGLPERSVSVLRAWLFEHFLHPYPTDADKQMLAKQTGLTRSQVSNWFINARVRLWKPMVEEMYVQEMRESSDMDIINGKRKVNESRDKIENSVGDEINMNKHGKMMLDGGGSDKQSASECEGSKVDHGCSTSQTAQESTGTAMSMPLETHFRPGEKVDSMREADMNVKRNIVIRESDSLSVNAAANMVDAGRKLDDTQGCHNFDQGMKRFRNDLDRNRLQGYENTVDFSYCHDSAGIGGRYEDLAPRQIGNAGVSLTLGLRHSGGHEKYNNGLYDSASDTNHHFNIHHHGHDQGYGSGFDAQNLQFRKHVGSQLLHDFVG